VTAPDEPADPLRELVAVMDRLRSPGGCPWDAEQTHASLVPYLLEEAHELAEAVDDGDSAGLREELGDVLLQVVFHARIAAEDADDPFGVDDVARDLVAKLVHRHPHVFAGADTPAERLHAQWDAIKKAEKNRDSALDGIPGALPALARAQKVAARAGRAGLDVPSALSAVRVRDPEPRTGCRGLRGAPARARPRGARAGHRRRGRAASRDVAAGAGPAAPRGRGTLLTGRQVKSLTKVPGGGKPHGPRGVANLGRTSDRLGPKSVIPWLADHDAGPWPSGPGQSRPGPPAVPDRCVERRTQTRSR
jgi:XTP/dITP diphosphohydrolase